MGRAAWWLNGLAAVAMVGVAFLGAQGRTSAVVTADPTLERLERLASTSEAALPELAVAYLERGQPGLAQAALDRTNPRSDDPELLHLRGRVAVAAGELEEAERFQALTLAVCAERSSCPSWLEARAERQLRILEGLRGSRVRTDRLEERRAMFASL